MEELNNDSYFAPQFALAFYYYMRCILNGDYLVSAKIK